MDKVNIESSMTQNSLKCVVHVEIYTYPLSVMRMMIPPSLLAVANKIINTVIRVMLGCTLFHNDECSILKYQCLLLCIILRGNKVNLFIRYAWAKLIS